MESKFSARLAELPGPVWVLGAYVVSRLGEWAFGLLMQLVSGSWRLGGGTALLSLIPAAGVGAARLRVVGLGRPEPLRVVARPLVCRAACGVAFRCAAHAALFRIRPASVRRYRNVYPGHCPECRMGRPVVPLPALSGALPCAGCRDVRGAPRPAPVVRCPDGRGVGDDDVGCAAGALGSGVRALFCLQSEKARCRVFVWHILGLKLAN